MAVNPVTMAELHYGVSATADPLEQLRRRQRFQLVHELYDVLRFDVRVAEFLRGAGQCSLTARPRLASAPDGRSDRRDGRRTLRPARGGAVVLRGPGWPAISADALACRRRSGHGHGQTRPLGRGLGLPGGGDVCAVGHGEFGPGRRVRVLLSYAVPLSLYYLGARAVSMASGPALADAAHRQDVAGFGSTWRNALSHAMIAGLPLMVLFSGPTATVLTYGQLRQPPWLGRSPPA